MSYRPRLAMPALVFSAVLAALAATGSHANTTYTNQTTAPVPGNSVLILDPTVYGGVASLESQESLNLGFDVDVVDATTWSTMTTANFKTFRAIIMGDDYCQGTLAPVAAALANRPTWSPAVTGNMILIGTDEALHAESYAGGKDRGLNLTRRGIYYAANQSSKTGAFISFSCYYDGSGTTPFLVPLLDQFGTFKMHGSLNCYNNAHIVSTAPGLTGASVGTPTIPLLLDGNLSLWGCSMHEGFDQWPANFNVFAIGQNLTNVYTATDGTVGLPYILITGEGDVISNITLGPKSAINPVGTNHTVCATISPAPPINTPVTFKIVSGPNSVATFGPFGTSASGVACCTYPDTGGAGTDYIVAQWSQVGADGVAHTFTSNTVTKTWTPCPSTDWTINGPLTTCISPSTYCVTPPPAGATFLWSVSNGTIVGPNNGPCVTINWNPTGSGVVTVTVGGPAGTNCPPVTREIGIKPCPQPPSCCSDTKFSVDSGALVNGPAGAATFTPFLAVSAGLGNIVRVTATVNTTSRTFIPAYCGAAGPVNSYVIGTGPQPNFNGTIPQPQSRELVWKSIPPGGVNLSTPQAFPMVIQFPTVPSWPCNDQLSFCIRFEFTDINCKTCETTVCFGPYTRKGALPWWDPHILTGTVGVPLFPQPVISLRDPDGNIVLTEDATVTLSIKPGTGTAGAHLLGQTTIPFVNGVAQFSGIAIDEQGVHYQLEAHVNDDALSDAVADSNPFNIELVGGVPIYHTTSPITIDGQITTAEWSGAPIISLGSTAQDILPGHWGGAADYSAQVAVKWDENNLYLAGAVRDDSLQFPVSTTDPDDVLGRDGLQMFIGLGDQDNLERESYNTGDFDLAFSAAMASGRPPTGEWYIIRSTSRVAGNPSSVAFVPTTGGYYIEAAIPWDVLKSYCCASGEDFCCSAGILGDVMGFNLQGRDNDQTVPGTDSLMSLTGLSGSETSPNRWTLATLLGAPPKRGDVNGDGVVDSKDVALALQVADGGVSANAASVIYANADFDGDGKVTLKDAAGINRLVRGL